jgi:hypothetical protein
MSLLELNLDREDKNHSSQPSKLHPIDIGEGNVMNIIYNNKYKYIILVNEDTPSQ